MSTTIVDDLQRATTAINNIQSAIERKTTQSLDNVPVEDYDDIIKNDMPSLKVNEHTKQTISFINELTLDDNTTAEEVNNKINYSNMFQKTLFNSDNTDSTKELTIELDITDNRSNLGPIEGTIANFMSAFKGLQGEGLTINLQNIASYMAGHSEGKFEDANFGSAFEKVNENLTLDDCDGKIQIGSFTTEQGLSEIIISTSHLESVLRNAKGIYTSEAADGFTLDLSKIFMLKASGGYARVGNMLNGFTAPNTDVVATGFDVAIDFSTDEVTGNSEYANMNVRSLMEVDLGYKNSIEEMYDAQMGRSRHALYNSTISDQLTIIYVPGHRYRENYQVPVSQLSSYLDLADVWDAIDFSELATAYNLFLQLGTDYQEDSTFEPHQVVVYKYADQQLSGAESAIIALGVTIVDIPRAEA